MLEFLFVFFSPIILFLIVFAFIGAGVYAFIRYAHKFDTEINAYVTQHHYTYEKGPVDIGLKGTLAGDIAVQLVNGKLSGSGNRFDLFIAADTSGGTNKKQTGFSVSTLRVKIPDTKTRFLLNSRKNDSMISNIMPEIYKASQQMQLEGNFNESFDVLCVENDKTELLTLLTPDVMAYMVDHLSKFDIEIIDDEIMFYHAFVIPITQYDETIALVDRFIEELRLRMSDSRSTAPLQQPVARIAVGKEPAAELVRKRDIAHTIINILISASVVAFFIFIFISPSLGQDAANLIPTFFMLIISLLVLSSFLVAAKRIWRR